jgi:hypothetical protein
MYIYNLAADEGMYCMALIVKALFCLVVELALFFTIIIRSCSGHIYSYGVALTVMHTLKAAIITSAVIKNSCC